MELVCVCVYVRACVPAYLPATLHELLNLITNDLFSSTESSNDNVNSGFKFGPLPKIVDCMKVCQQQYFGPLFISTLPSYFFCVWILFRCHRLCVIPVFSHKHTVLSPSFCGACLIVFPLTMMEEQLDSAAAS